MKIIKESSLSRLQKHMEEHDCGTISGFRSEYTKKENLQRNKSLLAKLQSKGLQVTEVDGVYIENIKTSNEIEVKEKTFFVVDSKDKGNLEDVLKLFGKEFEQGSIMIIPKGGKISYVCGTKDGVWPGLGERVKFPNRKTGSKEEFMTKIRGRPISFLECVLKEYATPQGYTTMMALNFFSKKDWRDLNVDVDSEKIL